MAYIVPRVLINQEFTQVPVFGDQPLTALVFGPQYNLYRYSKTDEKALTAVTNPDDASLKNKYQADEDVVYDLPNQIAGTFVDADYTKVFFEKAQIEYFPNDLGSTDGSIVRVAHPTLASTWYPNRLQASSLVFTTKNDNDRSDEFSNRDVKAGDVLVITNAADADDTHQVKVKALHATKAAAVIGTLTNDAANDANQSEDFNDAVVWAGAGAAPATPPANSSSNYDGHIDKGVTTDTITVEITAVGGALSDLRAKITSAAGAFADKLDVALDGSDVLILDDEGTNDVKIDFTSATTPVLGDTWTLLVKAGVVRLISGSTIAASLPFRGPADIIYKLTVIRGGPFYTGSNGDVCAKVAVTSNQLDSSASVNVQASTAFKVGSYGLTATISGSGVAGGGLILGDIYYIPVAAEYDDAVNIAETYESLPATLVDGSGTWDITSMRYVSDFEVPSAIDELADLYNWELDATAQTIEINSGITVTNEDIVDGDAPLSLDVKSANIFVEHRDLVVTNSISIGSINDPDEVEARMGIVDPDNPLAQGAYHAALNSANNTVYFAAVGTNDLSGYLGVLALATKRPDYYGLVPLTFDRVIQDAVVGHVNAMSTAEEAKWRVAWIAPELVTSKVILSTKENGEYYTGTITDDPLATGTQYKLVTVADAQFITDGVRPTDRVLINFRTNSAGKVIYDSFVVAEVRTETTLVLASAASAAISVPLKVEIERVYTLDEQADAIAAVGGEYNNRRVRAVFPPTTKNGTVTLDGYILAAALAGLRSGVVPHQGLTNTEVLGFTDLTLSVDTFSEAQLNRIAEQGVFIVTQTVVGSTPYVRHQLTTDMDSLNTSEDSVTTNVDSISYGLQRAVAPFIGTYNVHSRALVLIRNTIESELNFRASSTFTVRAGNQLNGYEIVSFAQNATFKDRVDAVINLEVPYPLNFINITLVV